MGEGRTTGGGKMDNEGKEWKGEKVRGRELGGMREREIEGEKK